MAGDQLGNVIAMAHRVIPGDHPGRKAGGAVTLRSTPSRWRPHLAHDGPGAAGRGSTQDHRCGTVVVTSVFLGAYEKDFLRKNLSIFFSGKGSHDVDERSGAFMSMGDGAHYGDHDGAWSGEIETRANSLNPMATLVLRARGP